MNCSGSSTRSSCCRRIVVGVTKACTAVLLLLLFLPSSVVVEVSAFKYPTYNNIGNQQNQRHFNSIGRRMACTTPTKPTTTTGSLSSSSSSPTSVILNHHNTNSLSMTSSKSSSSDNVNLHMTASGTTSAITSSSSTQPQSQIQQPRDIMFQIGMIVGQLCQIALTELPKLPIGGSVKDQSQDQDHANLITTLTELFLTLCQLCDSYNNISIVHSIQNKMILNNQKYPVELCKGKAGKYTQYSHLTGITKTNQAETTTSEATTSKDGNDNDGNNTNKADEEGSENSPSSKKSLFLLSKEFSTLAEEVRHVVFLAHLSYLPRYHKIDSGFAHVSKTYFSFLLFLFGVSYENTHI